MGSPQHGQDHREDPRERNGWGALLTYLVLFALLGVVLRDVVNLSLTSLGDGRFESPLLLWLVLLPAFGALYNGTIGQKLPRMSVNLMGCGVLLLSFIVSVALVNQLVAWGSGGTYPTFEYTAYTWIESGAFTVPVRFVLDPLSSVMILVVTGVGSLIHIYSAGYMSHDRGYARYFAYLNLFCCAMLILVLGGNLLVTFVGWEGVGMCSYLLIGFWFTDDAKASAGKKAFIVNRVGDFGFILGLVILFAAVYQLPGVASSVHGAFDYQVLEALAADPATQGAFAAVATVVALLFFVGATGKSAQIPLYVWLPDAMAGPTPVSALIHAATMVTAGVYLIARLNFLYLLAPVAMWTVVIVGSATALFAATMALVQCDIKKVLAYSTVSQLGYMFMAVGVGAYTAGVFHLMTHAFFKALLFLGAGSVIHGMGDEQDIRKMGGLRKKMPLTHITFLVACLAIAGVPGFSGFFSKDEILWNAFALEHISEPMGWLHIVVWCVGALTAGMTAFYMFRLYFLTFTGENRAAPHVQERIHESPPSMTLPLVVLAILSMFAGLLGVPPVLSHLFGKDKDWHLLAGFLDQTFSRSESVLVSRYAGDPSREVMLEWALMGGSVALGMGGIFLAWRLYGRASEAPARMVRAVPWAHRILFKKYYVDEIYEVVLVKPFIVIGNIFHRVVDDFLIDRLLVDGSAWLVESVGAVGKRLQTGNVQRYAAYIVLGLGAIIYLMLFR